MTPHSILDIFSQLVAETRDALATLDDWGLSGGRPTQYTHDVVADNIIVPGLLRAGFGVLSEESGLTGDGEVVVVVDPVDGSTNAARALPWYATSLCAVDDQGPLAAEVTNLATGQRFSAIRGEGAWVAGESALAVEGGVTLAPTACVALDQAIVAFSGLPPRHGGWAQFRAYGAAALDMCGVATGQFDGFVDVDRAHGIWDYLGALLICQEAGVAIGEAEGRELVLLEHDVRRGPVVAATPALLEKLLEMQSDWGRAT